jgi:hypothetical protein
MDLVNEIKKEISRLQRALSVLEPAATSAGARVETPAEAVSGKRRPMSTSARRRISLAQKARWEKSKRQVVAIKSKRTMSTAARKKIATAQKARWAKVRAKKAV